MMPVYNIEVTRRFEKDFLKLDKEAQESILEKLGLLGKNPQAAKHLRGSLKGYLSMRAGDYRVIFSIEEKRKTIILEHCGHRKRIYEDI